MLVYQYILSHIYLILYLQFNDISCCSPTSVKLTDLGGPDDRVSFSMFISGVLSKYIRCIYAEVDSTFIFHINTTISIITATEKKERKKDTFFRLGHKPIVSFCLLDILAR